MTFSIYIAKTPALSGDRRVQSSWTRNRGFRDRMHTKIKWTPILRRRRHLRAELGRNNGFRNKKTGFNRDPGETDARMHDEKTKDYWHCRPFCCNIITAGNSFRSRKRRNPFQFSAAVREGKSLKTWMNHRNSSWGFFTWKRKFFSRDAWSTSRSIRRTYQAS